MLELAGYRHTGSVAVTRLEILRNAIERHLPYCATNIRTRIGRRWASRPYAAGVSKLEATPSRRSGPRAPIPQVGRLCQRRSHIGIPPDECMQHSLRRLLVFRARARSRNERSY